MKHATRLIAVLLAVVFIFSAASAAFAISTSDAVEFIDISRKCSLSLTYKSGSTKYSGLEIEIFRIASVTSDFQYSMTGDFSSYPIVVNGISSQTEWNSIKETVGAYIVADAISATQVLKTNTNGIVKFENLEPGIYYIRWTGNKIAYDVTGFAPFLIALPGLGEDGKWIYDMEALPKPGSHTPPVVPPVDPPDDPPDDPPENYTVSKQWKESDPKKVIRPDNVEIAIFCDGALAETVYLTSANNWKYTWTSEKGHSWVVVERNVPKDYTVTIERQDSTFTVTNSSDKGSDSPGTADMTDVYLYLMLMALSGMALVVWGIIFGKKRSEDND